MQYSGCPNLGKSGSNILSLLLSSTFFNPQNNPEYSILCFIIVSQVGYMLNGEATPTNKTVPHKNR
jgi:hypothetical protein